MYTYDKIICIIRLSHNMRRNLFYRHVITDINCLNKISIYNKREKIIILFNILQKVAYIFNILNKFTN